MGRKSIKNPSKINQKFDEKSNAILDGLWMALGTDFGWIWGPSWGPSWSQVGTKSSSHHLKSSTQYLKSLT